MEKKSRNTYKQYKKGLKNISTYINNRRILRRIIEQSITSLCNFWKMAENYVNTSNGRKSINTHKQYVKCLIKLSTWSNDLRISWWMTKQNYSYFRNNSKIEYYVNALKSSNNQITHINNISNSLIFFQLSPMSLEYCDEYQNKTFLPLVTTG